MASRVKVINAQLARSAAWRKLDVNELADLIASRTGLDEGEIRQVLQELKDTTIYVQSPGPASGVGQPDARD